MLLYMITIYFAMYVIDALKYTFYTTEWLGSDQFYDLSSQLVSCFCGKHSETKVSLSIGVSYSSAFYVQKYL